MAGSCPAKNAAGPNVSATNCDRVVQRKRAANVFDGKYLRNGGAVRRALRHAVDRIQAAKNPTAFLGERLYSPNVTRARV